MSGKAESEQIFGLFVQFKSAITMFYYRYYCYYYKYN